MCLHPDLNDNKVSTVQNFATYFNKNPDTMLIYPLFREQATKNATRNFFIPYADGSRTSGKK